MSRVPAGVPTGGQFAASARPEATTPLGDGTMMGDFYTDDGRLMRRADAIEDNDLLVVPDVTGAERILSVFRIDSVRNGLQFTLAPIKGGPTLLHVPTGQHVEVFDGELTDDDESNYDIDEWDDYDEDEGW